MAVKKYFGTDGIRGSVGEHPITPEFVLKLGWAVGKVLGRQDNRRVLIGKDTRISGYMLESALEAGFSAAGMDVCLLGPMPTPGIAYLTRTLRAQAGVVISASHNAFHDNGIKFFSAQGSKLPDEIELAIEAKLEEPLVPVSSQKLGKATRLEDAPARYIEFCKSKLSFEVDLSQLKVVVDCANGATYHIAPNVLRELGAEVITVGDDPDGLNINESCGSLYPDRLREVVLANGADVGIALDGDGDRVVMVDHLGEILDGDELLYIMAKDYHQSDRLNGGVVGTVMSNLGLELALKEADIEFARSPVGDRYVLEELQARGWRLGGESSGHIIWLGATTTGDGIAAAIQVLFIMRKYGQSLHALKKGIKKFPQVMRNVRLKSRKDPLSAKEVKTAVAKAEKALGERGRVLLRPSGTEPVVRVMVEGEDKDQVEKLADSLASEVESALA